MVNDQIGNPTFAEDLARAIVVIAERMISLPRDTSLRGIFHVAGPDSMSWCEFAAWIMRLASARGRPAAKIVPISSEEYQVAAPRPKNSRLDSTKVRDAFGVDLPPFPLSLSRCLEALFLAEA